MSHKTNALLSVTNDSVAEGANFGLLAIHNINNVTHAIYYTILPVYLQHVVCRYLREPRVRGGEPAAVCPRPAAAGRQTQGGGAPTLLRR